MHSLKRGPVEPTGFIRSVPSLAFAVGLGLFAQQSDAQTESDPDADAQKSTSRDGVAEIVVTGVRAAQEAAIDIKRNAASVVDAISAEDIGKLPDVTIADSLQRITGVQIRREAGEGSAINIRGLPQVTTLLNGEEYLGAGSITTVQPNFSDIPSQLLAGAEVIKSPTAGLLSGGITGTVDLKTRRPFDLDHGWTTSVAVEGAYGTDSEDWDPQMNGLFAWRGDRVGVLFSAAYSDVTLANYYNGMSGNSGWAGYAFESSDFGQDVNGDGDTDDQYISYEGHSAYNKFTERKRTGLNGSLQFDLSDAWQLTADAFYTHQIQYDRSAGFTFENKWQSYAYFDPLQSRDTGYQNINTVQIYDLDAMRFKSYTSTSRTASRATDLNLELAFDNGGPFKGRARALYGKAKQDMVNEYADIDAADGSQWGIDPSYYPGGYQRPNPDGYSGIPSIIVDYTGSHMRWDGIGTASTVDLTSPDSYAIGALFSGGNYDREADMGVLRFDGSYEMENDFSIDGGVRYSSRSAKNTLYDYTSNVDGCQVLWAATDVVLNGGGIDGACTAGDAGGYYTAGRPIPLTDFGSDVIQVTDFGPVKGIPAAGIPAINPHAMDNAMAFQSALYPGIVRVDNPGGSYKVDADQTSGYLQANFHGDVGIPVSGNAGLRVVETKLRIKQNEVGGSQPYGLANLDAGDIITKRSFTDLLPAMNAAFDLRDDVVMRLAYAKTMTLLNLEQWGGALTPYYSIDSTVGSPTQGKFIVTGANATGNPGLDPWRADNYDFSLEWYLNQDSLLNVGLFYIKVASFIESGAVQMALPDQDGVVRRTVSVNTSVQGDGGVLKGAELGLKQSFTFLPGNWGNFGVDANFTYSPSDSGAEDLEGHTVPFQDNSVYQTNLVLWYQGEKFQARIADNYRSKRSVAYNQIWGTQGLTLYQKPTNYIDASVSYDITPDFTVYVQGTNLTQEYEDYYFQWTDQYAYQNIYERRLIAGIRARF